MNEILKPCPFCGSESITIWNEYENFDGEQIRYFVVFCNVNFGGCGGSSGYKRTQSEAIKAWNRREENS